MAEGRQLIRLALFGKPVSSSLSPAIHRRFAAQCGLDIEYRAVEADVDEFPGALAGFRRGGGVGCNVTLPLKTLAWRQAADCSPQAGMAQAANTLVRQPDGWYAHNTDGIGFMKDLQNHGLKPGGLRVAVLGAGGAVAGILGLLLQTGPAHVALVNRDLARARTLVSRFVSAGDVDVLSWAELAQAGPFDLLVNATSLGHTGGIPPLSESVFAQGGACYDLNYGDAAKPLREWCKAAGRDYVDGLGMLVEQAAASFEAWTGRRPDTERVTTELRVKAG